MMKKVAPLRGAEVGFDFFKLALDAGALAAALSRLVPASPSRSQSVTRGHS
jgi:hypothetical protein